MDTTHLTDISCELQLEAPRQRIGLLQRLWLEVGTARNPKATRPRHGNYEGDNEGDAIATPVCKRNCRSTRFYFILQDETCIAAGRKDGPDSVSLRFNVTCKRLVKYYHLFKDVRIQKSRMEPCRLVFPNFRRYHTWDESLGGVWTNLGRAPFQIGYIEQNDKPSGWAKPRRLLELFKNPDSTKWKVDALLNTGTRSNFVTAIIQLKEARSINAQPESVKIVKGKAKNISKGSSQWNSNHCNKACYESEAWLKSLVADQSTAYTGKRTIHAAYKGGGDNSKRHGKASKAIGFHSGYTGRSIAWLFTANGKGSDKCYCAIYRITWSWDSLSGRVCCSIESYEEGKTVWDVAILSCEGELVSDLYGQAQGVHLTEERRTIETFTGVEQQESNGLSPYAHIGGSMRLGPDDHSTIWFDFIQATSDAVLPDEFSTNPLEVPPTRKKYIYVWQCCACGFSRINIMVNECPECNAARCAYCKTEKVQVR